MTKKKFDVTKQNTLTSLTLLAILLTFNNNYNFNMLTLY